MELYLYNTLNKKKELFEPIRKTKAYLYTCGPTVYDFSHIGNFRTFVFEDLLKRWLLHIGYEVKHVMNITDVDDKTIKKSIDMNLSINKVTNRYLSEFMLDIEWLNILPADFFPKATEYIPEMISMINKLIKNNMAYIEDDGSVYFNISSFAEYGQLANIGFDNRKKYKSKRLDDEYSLDSVQDFVLWKSKKESDGEVFWDSPWGKGRPGWHIECSAMSTKILGDHFDIHCGGVDNIFPHHENEIAQSVGANKKKFVNYWVHSEHLMIDGNKMSKSKINYFTLKELRKKGFSAQSIRYQLLSGHYRTKISFSLNKKHESDKIVNRITDFYLFLKKLGANKLPGNKFPDEYFEFKNYMNDDLDTPKAIASFLDWIKVAKKRIDKNESKDQELNSAWNFICAFDYIFGFVIKEDFKIESNIDSILIRRKKARENKDWVLSDILRDELLKHGWIVEDTKYGQKLKRV
mgnify:CR=1 FL=1